MVPNAKLKRAIKSTLYSLKHEFGEPVEIYKLDSSSTDYRTGTKSRSLSKKYVRHAVVLTAEGIRKLFHGINYISESKQFVSLGSPGWDQDSRGFIFTGDDLRGYEWAQDDWIVWNDNKYEVNQIEELSHNAGYLVEGKLVKGSEPERVVDVSAVNTIVAEDATESE